MIKSNYLVLDEDDPDEIDENSEFVLEPVLMNEDESAESGQPMFFEIRTCYQTKGKGLFQYLRLLNARELEEINKEKGSGRHFIQEESDTKVVHVGQPDSINCLDTFKFDYPNNTEFLEMQFCGDMFQTMSKVVNLL